MSGRHELSTKEQYSQDKLCLSLLYQIVDQVGDDPKELVVVCKRLLQVAQKAVREATKES